MSTLRGEMLKLAAARIVKLNEPKPLSVSPGEILKLAAARIVLMRQKQAGLFDFLKRDPVDKMYDRMEKTMKRQMELKRMQMAYQQMMGGAVNVGGAEKKTPGEWGGYKDRPGGYKNDPKGNFGHQVQSPWGGWAGSNYSDIMNKFKGLNQ